MPSSTADSTGISPRSVSLLRRRRPEPPLAIAAALLPAAALLLAACAAEERGSPPAAEVHSVLAVPRRLEVPADGSGQLAAQVNDARGAPIGGAGLEFRSTDPTLISVSAHGLVRARGRLGEAAVIVTSGEHGTRVPVSVTAGAPSVIAHLPSRALPDAATSFVVRVSDRFGNAVPHTEVLFRVDRDEGFVTVARTDHEGIAMLDLGPLEAKRVVEVKVGLRETPGVDASFAMRAAADPRAPLKLAESPD